MLSQGSYKIEGVPLIPLPISNTGRTPREVAQEAARLAGKIQLTRFQGEKHVRYKGRANLVSDVDIQVEDEIVGLLRREFPDIGVLAEESEPLGGSSEFMWVLDPVDGTRNYVSGIPHFAVVIALARQDDILLGITYDPVRDEMFLAEQGRGAFLNDTPVRVSSRLQLDQCVLGLDMGYVDHMALNAVTLLATLWPGVQAIRVMGSAALGLAYAASGRVDLYFHHNLAPWDIACGLLLIQEAGGIITDRKGNPATLNSDSAVATSPVLHSSFMDLTEGLPWRTM